MRQTRDLEWQDYGLHRKYAHMSADDKSVWEEFIKQNPDYFYQVVYDLKVGEGHTPDPEIEERYKKMVKDLSMKRIDVFATDQRYHTIIEIKPHAALSACGQILVYHYLVRQEFGLQLRLKKMIICRTHDPDITNFCRSNQIGIKTI